MGRRLAAVLAALAVSACATGGKLRQNSEVVRSDVEKAKRSGAVRCAPRELALAEANVEFAEREVAYGHAARAKEHLEVAERSVKRALELSRSCAPTQVTIARRAAEPPEPEPKRIIRIEKTDRDGDGVPDLDDACPDLAGKPEFKGCPDADGDGIVDAEDACPKEAGPRETQGCPIAKDSDGDGIPDDIDRCPLDPEDLDAFQDEDGCPDADNDGDGIVDRLDACPNDAGPIENRGCPIVDRDGDGVLDPQDKCPAQAGIKENEGCPDVDRDGDTVADRMDKCPEQFGPPPDGCPKKYSLVEVKRERIEIRQQVHFDTAKYRILPASFPLLDQVVQVLNDFPKMRISIEGHTDSVGTEVSNLRLSQRRAEAVRDYLMAKGIGPARLDATGFGPTRPVASNKTAKGRAQNRRTEFRVVSVE
jgi:outer membrane protein OmpA-like peptidoglycan-associated protein